MKIIKTNLSIDNYGQILDHQSYVEEEESWEALLKKIESGYPFGEDRDKYHIYNLEYDDFHLSFDIFNKDGFRTKHLAFIGGYVIGCKLNGRDE